MNQPRRSIVALAMATLCLGAALPAFGSVYSDVILGDNPVGYWRLGELSGTTTFDSAGSHDGTIYSPVALGQPGALVADSDTSMDFSGGYVRAPFRADLHTTTFSLEIWAKVEGGVDTWRAPIMSRGGAAATGYEGYNLYASAYVNPSRDNQWEFWTGVYTGYSASYGPPVEMNEWAHLVGTFTPTSGPDANGVYTGAKKFYVNGELVSSTASGRYKPATIESPAFDIGGGPRFQGKLDEAAYYDTALSHQQVLDHFNAATGWIADADGNWSDATKWNEGIVPSGVGKLGNFSRVDITADRTVTVDSPLTVGHLKFGDVTASHDWILNTAGNLTLEDLPGGSPMIQVVDQQATISGALAGSQGLTKTGAGTLLLSGDNGYTGGTTIDQGTIQMGHANALGAGGVQVNAGGTLDAAGINVTNDVTLNGGTLYLANAASGTMTLNNVAGNQINANGHYRIVYGKVTGLGGFAVGGINTPGVGLINPANDFQGDVSINSGAYLGVWANEVIPDTANVTITGNLRLQGANRTETFAGLSGGGGIFAIGSATKLRVGANDATSTFSGRIGTGGDLDIHLDKLGAGTLTLTGDNGYTGGTTIDQGTIQMGHANALGAGGVQVNAGGTLDAAGINVTNDVTLNGGTLYLANAASGTITLNNVAGNQINANGHYRIVYGKVTGPGGFAVGGINTPGVGLINPANDFQGDVSINSGAYLGVWANEVIPDTANVTITGNLRLQGANRTETFAGLSGGGGIFAIGSATKLRVGANDATSTFSGRIGTAGDLDIHLDKLGAGTLTLTGASTYTGATTIDAGTLMVNGSLGNTAVAVNGGGTLGGTGPIGGTVTVHTGGTHAPGASVGSQTVGGATWMPGGTFEFEIDDAVGLPGESPGWDAILVDGTLDLTNLTDQDRFLIDIVSLADAAPGPIANFVATQPYEWPFLRYDQLEDDYFSPDLFTLRYDKEDGLFHNDIGRGYFTVLQMGIEGTNWLAIGYVPEPGSGLLMLSALAGALLRRRRKALTCDLGPRSFWSNSRALPLEV